ncbi:MAG TPA: hypothetical protein VLA14_16230 [Polyangia bacterium]|jgi:hypothetical protein|nr:hypothetical protein [Polyangia bacterium]
MKLGLVVAIGATVALSSAAARAERPRIAVMEMAGSKMTPDLRERMTHSVDEGLLASGADVVDGMPAAATGPGGAPCDGNGCVEAVAKATVSAYVLRGTLEIDGRTYELRLEMLDGKTGVLIESREDRCEICTEGEALEMAGVSASALKVQVFKKKPPVAATDVAPTAPVAVPPAATRLEVASPPSAAAASGHRQLGWIGVAAGVVAVVAGIWLISIDGDPTCSAPSGVQCQELRSTKGGGIAAIVGGAALGGAGALVLTGKF